MATENDTTAQLAHGSESWFLLMDPSWAPSDEEQVPPVESVVGVWPIEEDGRVGRFRANPDYVPTTGSPSDPLDAGLRLLLRGGIEPEQLQLLLRDSSFDVAMNSDGRPVVATSPDNVPCVVVVTAEVHRRRVKSPAWRRADIEDLVDLLPDNVDVLFNPGGPASVRLLGGFIRATRALTDEDVAGLGATLRDASVRVLPWEF